MSHPTPAAEAAPTLAGQRVRVLDGLRGYAILLVILSHAWVIAPSRSIDTPWLQWWFLSGSYAVTIFFVVSGFLATHGMMRTVERRGTTRPGVSFIRRWLRVSAHVYPMVVVMLVVTALQGDGDYPGTDTPASAWHLVTHTYAGFVRDEPLRARPDFGHMWYLSADIWVIGTVMLLVYLLGTYRIALAATLGAMILAVMVYRDHVVDTAGITVSTLVNVQVRADGILWGALAAVALPWLTRFRHLARPLGSLALVALLPLVWANSADARYLGWAGPVLNLTLAVFVVSVVLAPPAPLVERVLGARWLDWLGQRSLVLFIWHSPVLWWVDNQIHDAPWGVKAVCATVITFALAMTCQRFIEDPLRRWMAGPSWRRLDDGLLPAGISLVRSVPDRARDAWHSARTGSPDPGPNDRG